MSISNLFRGTRAASMFWLAVSLGSCAYVGSVNNQYTNTSVTYTIEQSAIPVPDLPHAKHCHTFQRQLRLGHTRPKPPSIDLTALDNARAADVILSYTEKLKEYIDADEKYLREDIARHNQNCVPGEVNVFEKGSGI